MNINFNGFNEKVLTFEADSTITQPNQWVKLTAMVQWHRQTPAVSL